MCYYFRLIGAPIVLDSFYLAEPFAAHFISQVVDDIVDTVRQGQRLFVDKDSCIMAIKIIIINF